MEDQSCAALLGYGSYVWKLISLREVLKFFGDAHMDLAAGGENRAAQDILN